jgi:hypothetical protein
LANLKPVLPSVIHLRDGEVVLYRRAGSPYWQVRYKLRNGAWTRESTAQAALENAIPTACELYDEARFRQKLGLAHKGTTFTTLAHETLRHLRLELDAGRGRVVYASYISVIERYFIPYFAEKQLETLTASDMAQFEAWRNRQMQRLPKASTLNTFASAWSKLLETGVGKGWISERAAIPKPSTRGEKSKPRPAFSKDEIEKLLAILETWSRGGSTSAGKEMRLLLRDYIEILLYTGIRHGTEAMGLCRRTLRPGRPIWSGARMCRSRPLAADSSRSSAHEVVECSIGGSRRCLGFGSVGGSHIPGHVCRREQRR